MSVNIPILIEKRHGKQCLFVKDAKGSLEMVAVFYSDDAMMRFQDAFSDAMMSAYDEVIAKSVRELSE